MRSPARRQQDKRQQQNSSVMGQRLFLARPHVLSIFILLLGGLGFRQCTDALSLFGKGAVSRRSLIEKTCAASFLITANAAGADPVYAIDGVSLTVPKDKSVLVLGANGGTGNECVSALLNKGRSCIATSRSGELKYQDMYKENTLFSASAKAIDVTSIENLESAIGKETSMNVGAVIFAASASTKGGNADAVDKQGVINAAKCCIANDIPRLVIVSSGTVTRPDSAVYKLLNLVGKGIMEAKITGEDAVRDMYAIPEVRTKGLGYTIVRPGGLTTGPSLGASALELNQGDNKSGRLSRADVAEICVNCLDSPYTFDVTFECYEADTAKPVESVGISNIMKSTDATAFKSGKEHLGETWEELFNGLSRD